MDEDGLTRFYVKSKLLVETAVWSSTEPITRDAVAYIDTRTPTQEEELLDIVWTAGVASTTWNMEGVERALGEVAWPEIEEQVRSFPPSSLPETRRW